MKNPKKYCTLGKLLKVNLVEIGETQKWLAETINVQPDMITRYCLGNVVPSAPTIYKISQALKISCNEIIEAIVQDGKNNG